MGRAMTTENSATIQTLSALLPSKGKQSLAGIIAAALTTVTITGALHWRAANSHSDYERMAMPVETVEFRLQDSYQSESRYLGLIEAGKRSELSFELPGKLQRLNVDEGDRVNAGDIIASLDSSALQARRAATKALLQRARADLELAQLQSRRQAELLAKGSVSQSRYDETRLRVDALQAQVQASEAQLRSIDIDLEKSHLRAPFDGAIAQRFVDEGSIVNPGSPVLRLLSETAPKAVIGVSPAVSEKLLTDEHYSLSLRGEVIAAKLLSLRPDVDPVTRTAQAVFQLQDGNRVYDGEPVRLLLQQERELRGAWLPLTALAESARGLWSVMVVDDAADSAVVMREVVEVINIEGNRAYVNGTVADGAQVVASGITRLAPGSAVSIARAE